MFDEQKHLQINTDNSEITKQDHNEQVNCLFKLIAATQDTLPYVCRHPPQSRQCVFLRTPRLNEWSPHPRLDSIYSLNLYSIHPIKNKISCCSVITCDYRHRCHQWHFCVRCVGVDCAMHGNCGAEGNTVGRSRLPSTPLTCMAEYGFRAVGRARRHGRAAISVKIHKYTIYYIYLHIYIFFLPHTHLC